MGPFAALDGAYFDFAIRHVHVAEGEFNEPLIVLHSVSQLVKIGFPAPEELGTLISIAHLFGITKSRTGIYSLILPNGCVYIGKAKDVVRRFAQHRLAHETIEGFSFVSAKVVDLDAIERELIFKAERAGLTLTNVIHTTDVQGATDLDAVMSPSLQQRWLDDPIGVNATDLNTTPPLRLPRAQVERNSKKYERLGHHGLGNTAKICLAGYLEGAVPAPRATEYSFWAVSCLPATNTNSWPRLLCVNAGMMELFVLGYYKDKQFSDVMWGFINVASDVLLEHFGSKEKFLKEFKHVTWRPGHYRDGGQHHVTLFCDEQSDIADLLDDERVQESAGSLVLRVMRKRPTIYAKYHCKQLADEALKRISDAKSTDLDSPVSA